MKFKIGDRVRTITTAFISPEYVGTITGCGGHDTYIIKFDNSDTISVHADHLELVRDGICQHCKGTGKTIKFQVFDNGKLALNTKNGWENNIFNSFEGAVEYASRWVGMRLHGLLTPDKPIYDYSGHGDKMSILELRDGTSRDKKG